MDPTTLRAVHQIGQYNIFLCFSGSEEGQSAGHLTSDGRAFDGGIMVALFAPVFEMLTTLCLRKDLAIRTPK